MIVEKRTLFQKVVSLLCLLTFFGMYSQTDVPFTPRYQDDVSGDITFLSNNIINRTGGGTTPNDPYNDVGGSSTYNNDLDIRYIDVDADPNTFSSSSATLNFNDGCTKVVYAGLYWSAIYPYDFGWQQQCYDSYYGYYYTCSYPQNPNRDDTAIDDVKLKLPGSANYIDITGQVIHDQGTSQSGVYSCYADVTSYVTNLANPNGEYTVANITSAQGYYDSMGLSAGWTLIIVYENPTMPTRSISTFDGFSGISGTTTLDVPITGFKTIPSGKVRAKIAVNALEGDNPIQGDQLSIKADSNTNFTYLSNGVNPVNNFFNSNITENGAIVMARNPNSINTLGYDTDIIEIDNTLNTVLPNNETGATLRLTSTGDTYYMLFNAFSVEVIKPKINVVKKVEDNTGADIGNTNVNLGDELFYRLDFQNIGNDDATGYFIIDKLPTNVNLDQADITVPTGVTYTYDAATHTIRFNIPDDLVEIGDPQYSIRFRVKVIEGCTELRDACSNIIKNQAFSTYSGLENTDIVSDMPSYTNYDACVGGVDATTNFLVNADSCIFNRTEILCSSFVDISAGDGYDTYTWTDASGATVGTDQTLRVTTPGVYKVNATVPSPCINIEETVEVVAFGTITNPLLALADNIEICPSDGIEMPEIFLCGATDERFIETGITNAQSIEWEKLDATSCPMVTDDSCFNRDTSCSWDNKGTGSNFTIQEEGEYRLILKYQNGCFNRFYFNVYKNAIAPTVTPTDIICGNPGNITVTDIPANYEFSLDNVNFSTTNPIAITTANSYTLYIRQVGSPTGGCVFEEQNIKIEERLLDFQVFTTDIICKDDKGSIRVQANNVNPSYTFTLTKEGSEVGNSGVKTDNDHTFDNLDAGEYVATVVTGDNCTDSKTVTIEDKADLAATIELVKEITCENGEIKANASGGTPPYRYVLYSKGTDVLFDVNNPDPSLIQTDPSFAISQVASYQIMIIDDNNCTFITNAVDVPNLGPITYTTTLDAPVACTKQTADFRINVTDSKGYVIDYSIDGGTTYQTAPEFTNVRDTNISDDLATPYTVLIRSTKHGVSCVVQEDFEVKYKAPDFTAQYTIEEATCDQEGKIILTATGGTPPYEYSLDNVNYQSSNEFLAPFDLSLFYSTYVKDANGCIANGPDITPDNANTNPITDLEINGTSNRPCDPYFIDVRITGGTPPFTYEVIAPATLAQTKVISDYTPFFFGGYKVGEYKIEVTDARGCTFENTQYYGYKRDIIEVAAQAVSNNSCTNRKDDLQITVSKITMQYNNTFRSFNYFIYDDTGKIMPNYPKRVIPTQDPYVITVTDLPEGTYTVMASEEPSHPCNDTSNEVTLTSSTAVLADFSMALTTPPTCNTNATIGITPPVGFTNLSYVIEKVETDGSITPVIETTNTTIPDLAPATYQVSVKEGTFCTTAPKTITIDPYVPATITASTNGLCYTSGSGMSITAVATPSTTGGYSTTGQTTDVSVAPTPDNTLRYALNGGALQSSNVFPNITPGNYTVTVVDSYGCSVDASVITIEPELKANIILKKDLDCAPSPTNAASMELTITGGYVGYSYEVFKDGVSFQAKQAVAATPFTYTTDVSGVYTFAIEDAQGCKVTTNQVQVADLVVPDLTFTKQDVFCFGDTTGSISLDVVAATGSKPFVYSINGGSFTSQSVYNNLSAGTYTVVVRDFKGCTDTETVEILQPTAALQADTLVTETLDCDPTKGARLEIINVTGGTAPYTYTFSVGGIYATDNFAYLTAGVHTVFVKDAQGCVFSKNVNIPQVLTTPDTVVDATTYSCDGTATITITHDIDYTYTYTIDGSAVTPTRIAPMSSVIYQVDNIAPGNHTLEVSYMPTTIPTGVTQCAGVQTVSFTILQDKAFSALLTGFSNVKCYGDATGTVSFTASNFDTVNGFEYSTDNGTTWTSSTTAQVTTAEVFPEGLATVLVRNFGDTTIDGVCDVTLTQNITQPQDVTINTAITKELTCANSGASIEVSVTGGTTTYEYQLEDVSGNIVAGYTFQSSSTFISVPKGDYLVRIKDTNNCEKVSTTPISILEPKAIAATITPTNCYLSDNNGQITVAVTDGNGDYQFKLNNGAWITPTVAPLDQYTFSGLASGTYTIDIKDGYGCAITQQTIQIKDQLSADIDVTDIHCNDGAISVSGVGGKPGYVYAFVTTGTTVNNTNFSTTATFAVNTPGSYDVYVRDNNGTGILDIDYCQYQKTVTVGTAPALSVTITPTDPVCKDDKGNVAITITDGQGPYSITFTDIDHATNDKTILNFVNTSKTFYNLIAPGDYTVEVSDIFGCTDTQTISIASPIALTAGLEPIIPTSCDYSDVNENGFRFINTPTYPVGTTLEYSQDGGATWQTTVTFTGSLPGTTVNPAIRTVVAGVQQCITILDPYKIPYPLEDLTLSASVTGNCTDGFSAQATASGGTGNYRFSIDLVNWFAGTLNHTFTNLIPGKSYTFYVEDVSTGCIVQNQVDVYDSYTPRVNITYTKKPICFGTTNTGEITFTVNDTSGSPESSIRWELFNADTGASVTNSAGTIAYNPPQDITVSNLAIATYYIQVTEVNASNVDTCFGASRDVLITANTELQGTPTMLEPVTCNTPGVVQISNVTGGTPGYTYTLTSTNFVNPITTTQNPIEVPYANLNDTTLSAFDIDVLMTDSYGCTQVLSKVSVNVAQVPTIDTVVAQNCTAPFGFTANVSGGSGSYYYSIDNGATYKDNAGVFTDLTPGAYTVSVLDKVSGCQTSATASITLHEPMQALVNTTSLLTCTNDAEITITATKGSGTYAYEVTGDAIIPQQPLPAGSTVLTIGNAGDYTIKVYDTGTGCSALEFPVTIEASVTPEFTFSATNVSCNGDNTGSITIDELDKGINPLSYSINPSPAGVVFDPITKVFSNLPQGTYRITGTGTNDCDFVTPDIIITQPTILQLPVLDVTAFACSSDNTMDFAEVSIDLSAITGGTSPYTTFEFIYDNATPADTTDDMVQKGTNTSYIVTNASGGEVRLVVYDDKGCSASVSTTVTAFDALLTASITVNENISCTNAGEDIAIVVSSTLNDMSVIEFSKDGGSTWQNSGVFLDLPIADHFFMIRHKVTGCVLSLSHTVVDPNTFDISVIKQQDAVCLGDTGTITIALTDSSYTGPFTWEIFTSAGVSTAITGTSPGNGPTNPIAVGAGNYYVEVTQFNLPECKQQSAFTILEPTQGALAATTVLEPITCALADGKITIVPTGGWGDYTYYIAPIGTTAPTAADYVSTPEFPGLSENIYQVWVRDVNGCVLQLPDVSLNNPTPITADLQLNNPNCDSSTGAVLEVVNVTGGDGVNYKYELFKDGVSVASAQASPIFTVYDAAQYSVEVSDSWSCTTTLATTITIYDPLVVGLPILDKDLDCSPTPEAAITLQHTGGSSAISYTVTYPDGVTTDTNTTGVFTGLSQEGTYVFTLEDTLSNCAIQTTNYTLTGPSPVLLTDPIVEHVSCQGEVDGSILVRLQTPSKTVNTDTVYTYEIIAGPVLRGVQNNSLFTDLPAGDYTIRVVSGKSCPALQTVTVQEPLALQVTATRTAFGCNTDGSAKKSVLTIQATQGTPPYTYSIDNVSFVNDADFYILDTGVVQNITYYVKDSNGCIASALETVNPLPVITDIAITQDTAISCTSDEKVLVSVSGGSGSYSYTMSPGNVTLMPVNNASVSFSIPNPGTYTVKVLDNITGCYYVSDPYIVAPFDTTEVVAKVDTPISCYGDTSAVIALEVLNYTGSYSYDVLDATGAVIPSLSAVATSPGVHLVNMPSAAEYTFVIQQQAYPFCNKTSNVVSISTPKAPLTLAVKQASSVTCDNNKGSIVAIATGGWYDAYQYQCINADTGDIIQDYADTNLFIDLSAANYTVNVRDDKGCVVSQNITLAPPTPISASLIAINTTLACSYNQNASITVNASGGEGTYTYTLLKDGVIVSQQSTDTFSSLSAGVYNVTVSDAWNCTYTTTTDVVVVAPAAVVATASITKPLRCTEQAEVTITALGGTAPYTFSQDGVTYTSSNVFALDAGDYQFYAKDSSGCISDVSSQITLEPITPLAISLDLTRAENACAGESTALVVATATGGLGAYTYTLLDNTATTVLQGPNTTGIFNALAQADYVVNVTSGDCTQAQETFSIVDPDPVVLNNMLVTQISCNGEQDGSIILDVTGGTGEIKYAISPHLDQYVTTNAFLDLAAGTYDIIIVDEKGCLPIFKQVIIKEPEVITATAINVSQELCASDGNAGFDLEITGGTPPYYTSLNTQNSANFVQDQVSFTGLASGQSHVVFIKDAMGCKTNITVDLAAAVNLAATIDTSYGCQTGSATMQNSVTVILEDPSIAADVLYALDGNVGAAQFENTFTNVSAGSHTISISHANGCVKRLDFVVQATASLALVLEEPEMNTISASAIGGAPDYLYSFEGGAFSTENVFTITKSGTYSIAVQDSYGCIATKMYAIEYFDIVVPGVVTPDGDGINDQWQVDNLGAYPKASTKIYDRYARLVKELRVGESWDGLYNGNPLPSGDYWYVLKLNRADDDREFMGHFTLIR